ncbi:MAG: RHS repeat-associated core domain-containing protein [Bacteroidales bacterium]|nr:RHS repeat-associated core domain-containing protein [Bacteroidales bacterium]
MIRLILTIMLSALAFVSMGANDCVTPTQAYDSNGGLVWEMLLDVYGEVMECHGDRTLVPFRYQGQYEDVETGLYYNRFRYYSPEMGMYISSDPIGLAGNNPTLYGYVGDVNIWLDPWGYSSKNELIKKKAPIDLGEGYRGRRDPFSYKGDADFEIHVYKVHKSGLTEVGVMDSKGGWIHKHGHTETPSLPDSVTNKLLKMCR